MNLRPVVRFLGRLLLLLAGAQFVPLLVAVLYEEGTTALAFLLSAIVTLAAGGVLIFVGRGQGNLYRREGILIVVGGWVLASIFGALPYLFAGVFTSPVDALFEAASGFTTTGATVLLDIEAPDRGILFWRSFTQWLGGMGIIVLFVALLPELGPGARFLYKLEVPGPTAEALQPRIHDTAATLWKIYLLLTGAQTALLMVAGMDLYDALTHTFSTLSTGGFSPRADSVAAYESPWIHLIVIVFMVLAGANFSLYYGFIAARGKNLLGDQEFRLYMVVLAVATLVISWDLVARSTYEAGPRVVLDSAFQVASIMTTTGFATADFDTWPVVSRMVLVALFFVGGCAGSTAGSMKVMRMVIGIKAAAREVRLIFSPNTVLRVFVGRKPVPNAVVRSVMGFFILYITLWAVGTMLLSIGGQDLLTTSTASAVTLGNIGPGLAGVGPVRNFAFFEEWHKLVMVMLMWMGRLEVYSIAALFTRAFWRP